MGLVDVELPRDDCSSSSKLLLLVIDVGRLADYKALVDCNRERDDLKGDGGWVGLSLGCKLAEETVELSGGGLAVVDWKNPMIPPFLY